MGTSSGATLEPVISTTVSPSSNTDYFVQSQFTSHANQETNDAAYDIYVYEHGNESNIVYDGTDLLRYYSNDDNGSGSLTGTVSLTGGKTYVIEIRHRDDGDGNDALETSACMEVTEGASTSEPIAVVLQSLSVSTNDHAFPVVQWQLESSLNVAGFRIWRSAQQYSGYVSLTENIIAANTGCDCGRLYEFADIPAVPEIVYWYKLEEIYITGESVFYGPVNYTVGTRVTANLQPESVAVLSVYPNPFNPLTRVSYQLQKTQEIELHIYNQQGQRVTTLFRGVQDRGAHLLLWDGTDAMGFQVSSGIYLVRLVTAGGYACVKKISKVK
ncbi:MAG: FlgD immunoglobulin-like domain containing protein [candidate division KSB1 bacterium]|nr:FlgD immunoglobulin-like domain containing protein [candidate division KSB1 bacterium]